MPAQAGDKPDKPGKRIILGRISGTHGVRGWLKVFSCTDPRDNIFLYQPWLLEPGREDGNDAWSEVEFVERGASGKTLIVRLPGIEDKEAALPLAGRSLATYRERLPEPEAGEYYWADLMQMEVVSVAGERLGKVVDLRETGANDVLVVQGLSRCLIPFVNDEIVREVDLDNGVIRVDWQPEQAGRRG